MRKLLIELLKAIESSKVDDINQMEDSMDRSNEFNKSIHYLIEQNKIGGSSIDNFHALIYIQKIICNSIIYNDCALSTLFRPHSSPRFSLSLFLTRNDNHYNYIDIVEEEKKLFLNVEDLALLTIPWSNPRLIYNLGYLGKDAKNPLDMNNNNIRNIYIYPLGIVLVDSGNHSQFTGLLKDEIPKIKIDSIYDISDEIINDDNGRFMNFYGYSKENPFLEKWYAMMEIGKWLLKYKVFPPEVTTLIGQVQNEK